MLATPKDLLSLRGLFQSSGLLHLHHAWIREQVLAIKLLVGECENVGLCIKMSVILLFYFFKNIELKLKVYKLVCHLYTTADTRAEPIKAFQHTSYMVLSLSVWKC